MNYETNYLKVQFDAKKIFLWTSELGGLHMLISNCIYNCKKYYFKNSQHVQEKENNFYLFFLAQEKEVKITAQLLIQSVLTIKALTWKKKTYTKFPT